jgi:hypothetical protein
MSADKTESITRAVLLSSRKGGIPVKANARALYGDLEAGEFYAGTIEPCGRDGRIFLHPVDPAGEACGPVVVEATVTEPEDRWHLYCSVVDLGVVVFEAGASS